MWTPALASPRATELDRGRSDRSGAFVAPLGGIVVGCIARREVRRTNERGDGLAFAAILIGATLTVLTVAIPAILAGMSIGSSITRWSFSL